MQQQTAEAVNTSGSGKFAEVPKEISGWSWGGFLLTWIWGLGNGTFIALLAFVPLLNLGVAIYLGVYGNELAWKNKYWNDVEDFRNVQRKWAVAGIIVTLLSITLLALNIGIRVRENKQSEQMANQIIEMVMNDPGAKAIVGDDAKIATNLGRHIVSFGNNIEYINHDIAIHSSNGMFTARADIKDEKVTSIKIIVWESDTKNEEHYTFKP